MYGIKILLWTNIKKERIIIRDENEQIKRNN
jgi:hypothetical protein